ncbi:MAG TPA: phosphotransferase [Gaiellaceae bacterium]|nr:phosphotransferase [Gaiellaceae bacterium]
MELSVLDAAVAVADAYGVHCEKPVVLREAWHVLVHLWPAPVVARVTSGAPGVDPSDVWRELIVASHAARAGAPVVRPSDLLPPGPHRHGGHTLVFWRYLARAGELDATAAGGGLHSIHEALADYDGQLPRAGRAEEVRAMLEPFAPSDDVDLLCELASRELPDGQALHGDAHLFNCIPTAAGPIWHDLETACRGPREYDLAALVLDERSHGSDPEARSALAAYGGYDEELLDRAIPVYAAWVAASFMVAVARRPDAAPALERQLRFLRRFRL